MPCGAGSRRTASVIAHPAAYAGLPEPAEGSQDRTDSTLSTAPPPFASMTGANARTVPSVPAWVEKPPSLTSTVASPAAVAAAAAESGAWRCRGSRARSRARRRLGERWTFLILREAPWDTSRFADLRARLGVAPDTLSNPYRVPGARQLPPQARVARAAGRAPGAAAGGDEHRPYEPGPTVVRRTADGRPVHVESVDDSAPRGAAGGGPVRPDVDLPGRGRVTVRHVASQSRR